MVPPRAELVLDYEPPTKRQAAPLLAAMRTWRSVASWAFWLTLAGWLAHPALGLLATSVLAVAAILTLLYMTRAAACAVSVGYAVRHLLLAVVLLPVLLMGVFLVPRLVEADLLNWRLAEQRRASP